MNNSLCLLEQLKFLCFGIHQSQARWLRGRFVSGMPETGRSAFMARISNLR